MERSAALALTSKIETTWSNRAWPESTFRNWTDALEELDEGAAGTAFARMRSNHPSAPTIAEFVAAVKALRTIDAGNRPDPCEWCSDTGWVDADDIVRSGGTWPEPCMECKGATNDERKNCKPCSGSGEVLVKRVIRYTSVKPCGCRDGRLRGESAAWLEHNPRRGAA